MCKDFLIKETFLLFGFFIKDLYGTMNRNILESLLRNFLES